MLSITSRLIRLLESIRISFQNYTASSFSFNRSSVYGVGLHIIATVHSCTTFQQSSSSGTEGWLLKTRLLLIRCRHTIHRELAVLTVPIYGREKKAVAPRPRPVPLGANFSSTASVIESQRVEDDRWS